jgi:hypothetical protein
LSRYCPVVLLQWCVVLSQTASTLIWNDRCLVKRPDAPVFGTIHAMEAYPQKNYTIYTFLFIRILNPIEAKNFREIFRFSQIINIYSDSICKKLAFVVSFWPHNVTRKRRCFSAPERSGFFEELWHITAHENGAVLRNNSLGRPEYYCNLDEILILYDFKCAGEFCEVQKENPG